jgi:hypothetical protein
MDLLTIRCNKGTLCPSTDEYGQHYRAHFNKLAKLNRNIPGIFIRTWADRGRKLIQHGLEIIASRKNLTERIALRPRSIHPGLWPP